MPAAVLPVTQERIQSARAASVLGITVRGIQSMAARGALPSAAKVGMVWTFDESVLRRWLKRQEIEPCPAFSNNETASFTDASSADRRMYEKVYEREFGPKRVGD